MLNPRTFHNARPEGGPALVVAESQTASPLESTRLTGQIGGPLARLQLEQIFELSEEQEGPIEALYRFPLNGEVAIQQVEVEFGEQHLVTQLQRCQQAREEYEQAKEEGRQAALMSQESEDVFTLRLAGIEPGQQVRVQTQFLQLASLREQSFELRIPLTVPPRFVREDEAGSARSQGQPMKMEKDPGHGFNMDLQFQGAEAITSSTHDIQTQQQDQALQVRAHTDTPDRDVLLSWQSIRPHESPLQVFAQRKDGETYFLGIATPPQQEDSSQPHPREVGLLVDHSGSMQGAKWKAADWGVVQFLESLSERDRFGLGSFESHTHWFDHRTLDRASAKRVQRAKQWVQSNDQSGGTQLGRALEEALDMERARGEWARHVLILTDAQVSDTGRLLRLVEQEQNRRRPRRISLICIDSAPNASLVGEMARRGGGEAFFLSSDPSDGDITTALEELLQRWEAPLWNEVELCVADAEATASRHRCSVRDGKTCIDLGPIRAGAPRWVIGKTSQAPEELKLELEADGETVATHGAETDIEKLEGLDTLFGAYRLSQLEALRSAFYPTDDLSREVQKLGYQLPSEGRAEENIYPEHQRAQGDSRLAELIAQKALEFGLLSSETALVAVGAKTGQEIDESVAVANALPQGWSEHFTGQASARRATRNVANMSASAGPALHAQAEMSADLSHQGPGEVTGDYRSPKMPIEAFPDRRSDGQGARAGDPKTNLQGGGTLAGGLYDLWQGSLSGQQRETLFVGDLSQQGLQGQLITGLRVNFPDGWPDRAHLRDAQLVLYVGQQAHPRARIQLAQLRGSSGSRPLNLKLQGKLRIELRGGKHLQGYSLELAATVN